MRNILFTFMISLMFIGCTKKGEDEVFLLPKDFVGYAIILYNQPDGNSIKYVNNNKRLFEIPPSRVLKTQFNADYGRTDFPEFYFEAIKDENRIPLVIDAVNYSENKVNASMPDIGKVYKNTNVSESVECSIFFIGTKNEINRASKEIDNMNIHELLEM